MKKRSLLIFMLFLILIPSICAVNIIDDFNDGIINSTIWNAKTSDESLSLAEGSPLVPSDEPLIFNFHFDELTGIVASESKQGNDATYVNNPNLTATGTNNTGVWFDGVNDYIDFTKLSDYDLTEEENLVMCFGFNGDGDFGADERLIDFLGATGVKVEGNGDKVRFTLDRSVSGAHTVATTTAFNDFDWHKICVVSTLADLKIYVDGVLDNTLTVAMNGSVTFPADTLLIGVDDTSTDYFSGGFDEFCFYKGISMNATKIVEDYNTTSTCTDYDILDEVFGYLKVTGKGETAGEKVVYATTDSFKIYKNSSGSAQVDVLVNLSDFQNQYLYFCAFETPTGYLAGAPYNCGACIHATPMGYGGQTDRWSVLQDANALANCGTITTNNWTTLKIDVSRAEDLSYTVYEMYFDGDLCYNLTQSTYQSVDCSNPELNITLGYTTFSVVGFLSRPLEARFENFVLGTVLLQNLVGAYCDDDEDCASGLCEYGFCVLKGARAECTSNDQCLSGVCSNGHCTQPSLWDSIDASKTQQFGNSASSNNFISLFFMIGIPAIIIIGSGHLLGVVAGVGAYFALSIFFTIVGWLNPFFLIGSIFVVLVSLVFGFMLLSGGSD